VVVVVVVVGGGFRTVVWVRMMRRMSACLLALARTLQLALQPPFSTMSACLLALCAGSRTFASPFAAPPQAQPRSLSSAHRHLTEDV
jgi:hypothetical protein